MTEAVTAEAGDGDIIVDKKVDATADAVADKTVEAAKDKPADDKIVADKAEVDKADAGDEGKEAADKEAKPGIEWNDAIREQIADGDADMLKLLKRYGSLKTMAKALKSAQATISSGKLQQAAPDPKDEKATAEWRKSQGIPDDPSGYKLPETVTKRMTDEDKPLISSFTEWAHAKGARPDVVEIASEWYFDSLEKIESERIGADKEAAEQAEEELRLDWGKEYKGNLTLASRFVETIPGVGKNWAEARMPDGRRLGDNPAFMAWASDQGRAAFGDSVFASSDSEKAHMGRRAEIEKIRDTDFDRYEREGLDRELTQLTEKDLKRGKR